MNASPFLLALLALGCARGDTSFSYQLASLAPGAPPEEATPLPDCGPVASLTLLLGDDFNGDGQLQDDELDPDFSDQAEAACDQLDANADGALSGDELGRFFAEKVDADLYDLAAVELRDASGALLPWRTLGVEVPATRIAFRGGFTLLRRRELRDAGEEENLLAFPGRDDGALLILLEQE